MKPVSVSSRKLIAWKKGFLLKGTLDGEICDPRLVTAAAALILLSLLSFADA